MGAPRIGLDDSRLLELELRQYRNPVDQANAEKLARDRNRVRIPDPSPQPKQAPLFQEAP